MQMDQYETACIWATFGKAVKASNMVVSDFIQTTINGILVEYRHCKDRGSAELCFDLGNRVVVSAYNLRCEEDEDGGRWIWLTELTQQEQTKLRLYLR